MMLIQTQRFQITFKTARKLTVTYLIKGNQRIMKSMRHNISAVSEKFSLQ